MDEKHQMVYLVEIFGTHDVKVEHSNVLQAITGLNGLGWDFNFNKPKQEFCRETSPFTDYS